MPEIGTTGLMSVDGTWGGGQTSAPAPIPDSGCPDTLILVL
jgi:hypothetical protein